MMSFLNVADLLNALVNNRSLINDKMIQCWLRTHPFRQVTNYMMTLIEQVFPMCKSVSAKHHSIL